MRPNSQSTATLDDGRLLLSGGMPFFTPDFSHREDFFFFFVWILHSHPSVEKGRSFLAFFLCECVCVCVLND